jgi:hypothetical protein
MEIAPGNKCYIEEVFEYRHLPYQKLRHRMLCNLTDRKQFLGAHIATFLCQSYPRDTTASSSVIWYINI